MNMNLKLGAVGVLIVCYVSLTTIPAIAQAPGTTPDQTGHMGTSLEELGVSIQVDKPEGAVLAVALPDVYILPDSKFYWIVEIWEWVRLVIEEDQEKRADLLIELSQKRLAETYGLLKKDNVNAASENIERYKVQIAEALGIVQQIPDDSIRMAHYDAFEEQVWYQKALSQIIQVEGITNIFTDVTNTINGITRQFGSLELENIAY